MIIYQPNSLFLLHIYYINFSYIRRVTNSQLNLQYTYLLLTEFEGHTVSYRPSFFLLDLWPKHQARGP